MRTIIAIIATVALAGCGAKNLQQGGATPFGANRLADALSGRAPGAPVACLPAGRTWQSERGDGNMIAYRRGSQIYVSTFEGSGCSRVGRLGYALVTRARGPGMCRGDIAWVMHTGTREIVGSCVLGPFIPYNALRSWH